MESSIIKASFQMKYSSNKFLISSSVISLHASAAFTMQLLVSKTVGFAASSLLFILIILTNNGLSLIWPILQMIYYYFCVSIFLQC